jgi:multicomponent Na+:H+ antiporter subunit D
VFTAALCIILFFLVGPLADFLAPSMGGSAAAIVTGGQP